MEIMTILILLTYLLAIIFAVLSLWRSRTPQGAMAWILALLGFPYMAVPLFLLFGRKKFFGYLKHRHEYDHRMLKEIREIEQIFKEEASLEAPLHKLSAVAAEEYQLGFTDGNQTELLINGEQTYLSMLKAIEEAQKYILLQVYIFREDEIGNRFAELLMHKARSGVKVYLLCDQVGTSLRSAFVRKLKLAGIEISLFSSWKDFGQRIQINFRNHRKIMVTDGTTAFVGGLNIGDDYLGRDPEIGPWRDTHLRIQGPSALAAQLSFMQDWLWARNQTLDLDWTPYKIPGGHKAMILQTGPVDTFETSLLCYLSLIKTAEKRIWITTPYFIPVESLINALLLAVLQGIEVKILLPSFTDNPWIKSASYVYLEKLINTGIQFYEYGPGFIHQKVMLIDDKVGVVGSANLDPRSLFINFEIMAAFTEVKTIQNLTEMLEQDFSQSLLLTPKQILQRPLYKKLASRIVNLMSPML